MSAIIFDPALYGQPLSRPRKRPTTPLGMDDGAARQRERAAQLRAHRALLHGVGTQWGLVASAAVAGPAGRRTRVLVSPGLAVDAFGREIYVEREQCLDVTTLVHHAIWCELVGPDGTAAGTVRRAYIVLRYDGPPGDPGGPAQRPPRDGREAEVDGRGAERFRLELAATPPEGPAALRRECVSVFVAQDTCGAADPRLELLLQDSPPSLPPPSVRPELSPLLLATVDLDVIGTGAAATAFVAERPPHIPNPDYRVRPVLPDIRRIAEALFGDRLPLRSGARR